MTWLVTVEKTATQVSSHSLTAFFFSNYGDEHFLKRCTTVDRIAPHPELEMIFCSENDS